MIHNIRAAVASGRDRPVVVESVSLLPPGPNEVLIQMKAAGICHSDMSFINGERACEYPVVLGHEGAGVVVECGSAVTTVKPGDHVIPVAVPECGVCPSCLNPKTNLCDEYYLFDRRPPDARYETARPFKRAGESIRGYCDLGTFAEMIVVREMQVTRIRPDAPLDVICCLGCAGLTGLGAALFTARVEQGSSVVVFGLGGIGMNVIAGARLAGARMIIGVDTNPEKEAAARLSGMTHFVNPNVVDDLVGHLRELSGGGADYSFECVGRGAVLQAAINCTRRGWGTTVMIGVPPGSHEIAIPPRAILEGRRLMGSLLGNTKTRTQLPELVDLYMDGKLSLDSMISHRIELDEINKGFSMLSEGTALRTVISF